MKKRETINYKSLLLAVVLEEPGALDKAKHAFLGVCLDCGKIYRRTRMRQKYCDGGCRSHAWKERKALTE